MFLTVGAGDLVDLKQALGTLVRLLGSSATINPVARLTVLVGNSVNLRSGIGGLVYDGVGESIKVVNPKPVLTVRPSFDVFNQQVADPFEFGKKRLGNSEARMLSVVKRGISKLRLSLWMEAVAHARRARTRASAAPPGTIATVPARTASRRALAAFSHWS